MEQYFGGCSPGISCPLRRRLLIVPLIMGGGGAVAASSNTYGSQLEAKRGQWKGRKRGYVTVAMAAEERVWRPWFL